MYAVSTFASRDNIQLNQNRSQIGQVWLISLLASYVVSFLVQILG